MPVAGRKPKPEGQKRNRHAPTHDWVEVLDVPFAGGPKLPAKQGDGRAWPARTRQWWRAISAMPHCVLWTPGDWEFALDTAALAATFHGGDMRAATELRNRERVLGTTLDFRRDIRVRYVAQVDALVEAAGVTNLDAYRDAI